VVLEAKLNENEKNILEQPLRIEELDRSINNAKLKSAPGADGFSNEFIKKFWDIFRVPLFNLANSNYNDNNLHESFRTANIKLIPKKGDLRQLKNWRPISLLNCFYKVISRAITARLKKVMDKLTPTSQKGYSSTRRCQEVLMGLIEGIHECKTQNKRGAIISLDIRKAFDTLSHRYMEHCLDFFNFGPNFKKWLILLSTNRKACIILGTGRLSKIFKLKRGNAQGDIISPFLFLLGYQILLFKLQFDLQIVGILDRPTFSTDCRPLPPEVRTTPPKVLAMADDANCLVSLELDTLLRINNILTEFGILSGLECNIEKTALIPIGPVGEISQEIKNIGFEIKTSAIILGMKIHNNIIGFEDSAISIINSINKEINFWVRFRLSLPGRINVAKSMLYSQLNYLGSFIPFDNAQLQSFSEPIIEFVRGNLNIAKSRIFLNTSNGGLGLTDIRAFLGYQKCAWLKLALKCDEHWKLTLYAKSNGNILNIRSKWLEGNPILKGFGLAAEQLLNKHININENFWKAPIFEQPFFCTRMRPVTYISYNTFGMDPSIRNGKVENLRVGDFYENMTTLDHNTFRVNTGIEINIESY